MTKGMAICQSPINGNYIAIKTLWVEAKEWYLEACEISALILANLKPHTVEACSFLKQLTLDFYFRS